ncbi:MAG: copper chaperone PCu(A)C [Gammaproteobacteria bacterium]|nr:copper chaperone PCu(A)C [Gammaproteobacteria bacterium]
MKYFTTTILAIGMMLQASLALAAGTVKVHDAWIPQAPPVADVLAAYLVVENTGSKPVTIVGATSPDFAGVMMHKTITENGVARMVHESSLTIAPKSKLVFERGGLHLMLMSPKHGFKLGDKVHLSLETADKHKIPFTAIVKEATLGDDQHHDHQH